MLRSIMFSALAIALVACTPAAAPAPTAAPAAAPTTAPAAPAKPVAPAAAAGTVSCAEHATQGAGGAPIKMGADGSLTGGTANFGTGMKRGIEICLKEFNDAGGYQGRKVEIPMLDDQVKPEIAVNNITRFLEQDKVIGIIGPVNSGNALAFIPKTEEAEIPVIIPISTTVGVVYVDQEGKPAVLYGEPGVKPRKFTFRTSMQDNYQVEILLNYGKSKGWDAVGLMNDTSGYGTGTKATGEKLLAQSGIKILDQETFNIGDTDMTSQLQKMKDAGVKQIIDFGLPPENANLLRSAQKIDYNEDIFPITSAQAYDATKMMLQALSKSGPDANKLRDAIENIDGFQGVTAAPAKPFSADRHHSLEAKDMFAAVWKSGVLVKAQ